MTWTTRPRSEVAGFAAIKAGHGPKVLLLHGVGLRAEAWNLQIDALADHFEVTALDLPGHGESAAAEHALTVSQYADAVLQAITGPTVVVGHSMGAMIALDLALRFPARVRGVAALNAIFERSPVAAKAVRSRADALDGLTVPDATGTLERWFGTTPSPERSACQGWLNAVNPAAYKTAYSAFATGDGPLRTALASLVCPALFLTGGQEPNSTPKMSDNMAEIAPRGGAIIIEAAAHMMPMTHPAEVNDALINFVRGAWT